MRPQNRCPSASSRSRTRATGSRPSTPPPTARFTPRRGAGRPGRSGTGSPPARSLSTEELEVGCPLDKNGYLAVGSGEQTFPIHVGAYVAQVGTIDAVVNTEWGEALGLPENNALVINTGGISPQAVREKLKAARRRHVDHRPRHRRQRGPRPQHLPDRRATSAPSPRRSASSSYTPIGGGRVQPEAAWVRSHIVTETVPILGSITCNKCMMPQLKAALAEVQRRGLADEITTVRRLLLPALHRRQHDVVQPLLRAGHRHQLPGNQRGTVGQMHPEVVAIFKYWGFAWGGDWNYTDPMHFELERDRPRADASAPTTVTCQRCVMIGGMTLESINCRSGHRTAARHQGGRDRRHRARARTPA